MPKSKPKSVDEKRHPPPTVGLVVHIGGVDYTIAVVHQFKDTGWFDCECDSPTGAVHQMRWSRPHGYSVPRLVGTRIKEEAGIGMS